ncbi:hypothetical protein C1878_16215 [Gordonibacter sp. 28C]|nr:hypothetical protein C1878_16215 [Gordonibacter sp. 28C]
MRTKASDFTMNDQAPRRERQDAVKNRARILEAAQDLFASEGVENVSMNRIAQAAEVGAGTLYRHFGSKSDLCFALMQDQLVQLADQLADLSNAGGDDPQATLETMVLHYLRFKESKRPLFKGMEQAVLCAKCPQQGPVYESLNRPFSRLFERAAGGGALDPAGAVFRADMLLAALVGDSLQLQRASRGLALDELAAKVAAVFYPKG